MSIPIAELAPRLPEFDYASERYARDPYATIQELRGRNWLARSVRGFEVLSWPEASALLVDREHLDGIGADYYSQQDASAEIIRYATEGMLPLMPWVRHDPIRKVLQKAFNARDIRGMREDMRTVATRLIQTNADAGHLDFVSDFLDTYPIENVCRLLGIPTADVAEFTSWTVSLARLSHNPVAPYQEEIDDALRSLYDYFGRLVETRRVEPGDDFVSALIRAAAEIDAEGFGITEAEMFGALVNLLFAGHDTTRLQLGWAVFLLMQNRDQWELLVESPELAPQAVEEAMRLTPSLHTILRTVTGEFEVRGVRFVEGESLSINIPAANRDPEIFDDPDRFSIERPNAAQHLTFGRGHRLCLGQLLARSEMRVALEVLAENYPDLSLAMPEVLSDPAAATYGPERLVLDLGRGV
ncbi:cytochrome P450 [Williamsia soli]|uniref:cytochrome P450 n=1 Tax=Williamsia soli TaxID=364929 RepID=UPI001A9FCD07|nr:cytochrome P450 [Williamsia soli]